MHASPFSQTHHLFSNDSSCQCTFLHRIQRVKGHSFTQNFIFISRFMSKILSKIMTGYKHRKYFFILIGLVATPGKAAGGKGSTLTPKLTLKLTLKHKTTSK